MRKIVISAVVLIGLAAGASGAILDWNDAGIDYTGGAISESFVADGVTLDFEWTGDTGTFLGPPSYPALPDDDPSQANWGLAALWEATDFSNSSQAVTLTISFSSPVTDLSFPIYDLDGAASMVDQVLFSAYLGAGEVGWDAVTYGSQIDFQLPNILYGNKSGNGNPGDAANTAEIGYVDALDKLVLVFGCGPGGPADPDPQGTLLGNLEFVPEPATLCVLAFGGLALLRRRRQTVQSGRRSYQRQK